MGKILTIILLIVSLAILIVTAYLFLSINFDLLYLNRKPVQLNTSIISIPQLKNSVSGHINQFYPNMKFNHNNISYKVDINCNEEKKSRILNAFKLLSNEILLINFSEAYDDYPDIEISCTEDERYNPELGKDSEFFIAGEGGAKGIVQTERYNVINKGIILLYHNPKNSIECSWPITEVHETIHVFGFNHSSDKNSLMYPYLESCDQKLDESILNELKKLYSEPNLADLYFENLTASKKDRYLDFNFTIKNSGDIDVARVNYSILEDGIVTETKELKKVIYGGGIIIRVTNFKLYSRNSNEIKIIVDYDNSINEIDEQNNVAIIRSN